MIRSRIWVLISSSAPTFSKVTLVGRRQEAGGGGAAVSGVAIRPAPARPRTSSIRSSRLSGEASSARSQRFAVAVQRGDDGAAIYQRGFDELDARCAEPELIARALIGGFGG